MSGAPVGASDTVESPTLALADLLVAYPELSVQQRRQADRLLARPTDSTTEEPLKWGSSPESDLSPACGPRVCVHWTNTGDDAPSAIDEDLDGIPDWVRTTLSEVEAVWDFEVGTLGYRAPASDGTLGNKGGDDTDGLFDVYLGNLGPEALFGYCAPEELVSGQSWLAYGYCVLDNDYAEFPLGPLPSLKVTAAHEFFHAIQFNYDVGEDNWFKEATATWMEERVADSVNDNRGYLKFGQLGKPARPLDTFEGLTHYGNWLFFERFSAKYGVAAVRSLWNRLDAADGAPDQYSTQALKGFLNARGSSLPSFYGAFAAGNLIPERTYSEGAAYRASPFADTFKLKARRVTIRPQTKKLRHLASASYRFKAAKSLRSARKLKIIIDAPKRATSPVAVAYTHFQSGKITKKRIPLSRSGAGSAKVKFNRRVTKVTLTLANASSRFSCNRGGVYSCDGIARDDPEKFEFSVKVLR